MSILITGMEMPKNCDVCFVKPACCPAIRKRLESKCQPYTWIPANYRHEDCPLVEVPPHGRLLDADDLLAMVKRATEDDSMYEDDYRDVRDWLAVAPTIIEAEEGE